MPGNEKNHFMSSFLALGVTSVISQVVIQRELITALYGNEFFVGLILASWFFWTAIGSGYLKKVAVSIEILAFSAGFLLFLEILAIRLIRNSIGAPGEIPNLVSGGLVALAVPAPICLLLGSWWTTATTTKIHEAKASVQVSRAYFVETLGFILGGILFSFFFVLFQEFLTADLLVLFNLLLLVFFFLAKKTRPIFKFGAVILFAVFVSVLFTPYLNDLNWATSSLRYKGQELVLSKNSLYGRIDVTRTEAQNSFYENGVLLGSTEKVSFTEEIAHLPLLQHPSPRKVMLMGGGFTGVVNEILKHSVDELYYVELDPALIKAAQDHVSGDLAKALADPSVKIVNTDGRYFLKKEKEKFDAIIVNLPAPATALINRFYTEEFFKTARERLNPGGIFATCLPFSASAPARTLEDLNASIFGTLKKVFEKTIVLPEDTNIFISSADGDLSLESSRAILRLHQREISTDFISDKYITYRLTTDRIEKTLDSFEKNKRVKTNRDFFPIAYFYQNLFWLDHFYPGYAEFVRATASHIWLLLAAVSVCAVVFAVVKKKGMANLSPVVSMGVAGFSLMAMEIVVLFTYQIVIGFLYYRIALLISALMAGMALGVLYGNGMVKKGKGGLGSLRGFHLAIMASCFVFPFLLKFISNAGRAAEPILLLCAVAAGFLGAAIFPISNKIYFSLQPDARGKSGVIYSADLMGSCLGALLPGLVFIPVYGVKGALTLIASANILILIIISKPRGFFLRRDTRRLST